MSSVIFTNLTLWITCLCCWTAGSFGAEVVVGAAKYGVIFSMLSIFLYDAYRSADQLEMEKAKMVCGVGGTLLAAAAMTCCVNAIF